MDIDDFAQAKARQQVDQDIQERIKVHKANVLRLQVARQSAFNLSAAVVNDPLVMLAQGDSWFDYPLTGNGLPLTDTDIIAQLRRIGAMPPMILNLAHHGETAVNEMSLPKQQRMIEVLSDRTNWPKGKPDAILISAGGNDIAGDEFCIVLDFNDGRATGLNAERFTKAVGMVEACYLDLFALRDRLAPGVPIVGHCYDFPIPNGAHPPCVGPWLKPALDFCNWPAAQGRTIVRDALTQLHSLLTALQAKPGSNFHFVDTQGTLSDQEWANELHPTPEGFGKIAAKFSDTLMKMLRPATVVAQGP